MTFIHDPFFWALISMFGLVAAGALLCGDRFGKYGLFGFAVVAIFTVGRLMLALPYCPQPRFESGAWPWIVGGVIFANGLILCTPSLNIKPFTAPDKKMKLRTSGFYRIVRNPIYLGDLLWGLGWSIMFRSVIGIALVPLWWLALLFVILIEEQSLERELGSPYLEYKNRVRGRIIPGLPI